jgi:hypothetical protein
VKTGAEGVVVPPLAPLGAPAGAGLPDGVGVEEGAGEGTAVPPVDSAGAPCTIPKLPRIATTIGVAVIVSRRRNLLPFCSADGVS